MKNLSLEPKNMKKFFITLDFSSEPSDNHFALFQYKKDGKHIQIGYSRSPKELREKAINLGMIELSKEDRQKI